MHGLHFRSPEVVKLVHGLHQESPWMVELEVGFYNGYLGSDHRSPRVVKLEVGLHQRCYIREQEVSWSGEASDGASSPKVQEDKVHDGTLPWKFQGA